MNIKLMDLARQTATIKDEYLEELSAVLDESQFIMGENVKKFEKRLAEYIGVKHAISVGNGTDALAIALRACGVQPGDEVIVPGMTFFATAEAVSIIGAVPVFVDINPITYCIEPIKIVNAITNKTSAIIPVHLYGHPANMIEIMDIAKKYDLKVIEDVAQAIGAQINGTKAGSFGNAACISFFPTKNLGAFGDGGIILTNLDYVSTYCKALRVHGSGESGLDVLKNLGKMKRVPAEYQQYMNSKYNNSLIGYNSRLDEIQALALNIKLNYLNEWNLRRADIANRYNKEINNPFIKKPQVPERSIHVFYTYIIQVENRNEFIKHMDSYGVGTGVYFPIPLHKQTAYIDFEPKVSLPYSENLAKTNIAIPIFPELTEEEVSYIISVVNSFRGE